MKNYIYILELKLWIEFHNYFFVVNDIDRHQLNLGPFRSLQILVENPFKNVFFAFFEQ